MFDKKVGVVGFVGFGWTVKKKVPDYIVCWCRFVPWLVF